MQNLALCVPPSDSELEMTGPEKPLHSVLPYFVV